jgi:hypothetical protein
MDKTKKKLEKVRCEDCDTEVQNQNLARHNKTAKHIKNSERRRTRSEEERTERGREEKKDERTERVREEKKEERTERGREETKFKKFTRTMKNKDGKIVPKVYKNNEITKMDDGTFLWRVDGTEWTSKSGLLSHIRSKEGQEVLKPHIRKNVSTMLTEDNTRVMELFKEIENKINTDDELANAKLREMLYFSFTD